MDVEIYLSGSDLDSESESESESGNNIYHRDRRGGCELGFNVFAFYLTAVMLITRCRTLVILIMS